MNRWTELPRLLMGVRTVIYCECPRCGHVIEVRKGGRGASAPESVGGDVCRLCEVRLEYGEAGLVMVKERVKSKR